MVEMATRKAPSTLNTQWLTTLPPAGRYAFYGDAAARTAALPAWEVEFSDAPLRANIRASRATLWLGPDEYLLLELAVSGATRLVADAPGIDAPRIDAPGGLDALDALERALADIPHSLVDISHRQFALEVSGPHAETILSGACPLDLDATQFPVGMCTRTVLAKADIVLWRTRADAFHLEVWRSFAGYVTGILTEIAAEFYPAK
jgi:sarcosine oxidase subunit gamma